MPERAYTHNKHCQALKTQVKDVNCYEPGFHEKEADKAVRKPPEVPPNVEFVERVRQAAMAWHKLDQDRGGLVVRNFYKR